MFTFRGSSRFLCVQVAVAVCGVCHPSVEAACRLGFCGRDPAWEQLLGHDLGFTGVTKLDRMGLQARLQELWPRVRRGVAEPPTNRCDPTVRRILAIAGVVYEIP